MKRFWRDVSVVPEGDRRSIALDGRPVRTPGRAPLAVPTAALADAIAEEWRAVTETVDPRAMPLTGLANAAIDRVGPDRAAFAAGLARFGESDLLYYRAEGPVELVARQANAWDPILDWCRGRYGIRFEITAGVMHVPQPETTVTRLAGAVAAYDPFVLAPLSPIVSLTGSLVLALALAEGAATPDAVWTAASIDEDWQAEQWGEDDLATAATANRRAEFQAAARFLELSKGPLTSPGDG
ncbi:ATP12 family chaperone protein [Stakelama saccharophila]|uniref:ATP12 family protein n=1 Tax=Stakelama saccharophila TaxID=3075605 RepID=A0ABZ0BBU6_9SPHN|nr:ATP12 family protein [Stakelama sp. W311]WNO54541.1 ATP12 family protein [Stakelama sp. W311]